MSTINPSGLTADEESDVSVFIIGAIGIGVISAIGFLFLAFCGAFLYLSLMTGEATAQTPLPADVVSTCATDIEGVC